MGMKVPTVALNMVRKMKLSEIGKRAKWLQEKTNAFIEECNDAIKNAENSKSSPSAPPPTSQLYYSR